MIEYIKVGQQVTVNRALDVRVRRTLARRDWYIRHLERTYKCSHLVCQRLMNISVIWGHLRSFMFVQMNADRIISSLVKCDDLCLFHRHMNVLLNVRSRLRSPKRTFCSKTNKTECVLFYNPAVSRRSGVV